MVGSCGLVLASNASATQPGQNWKGGKGVVITRGTWGGGSAKLQCTLDGTNWIDVGSSTSFTTDGIATFELPACQLRCNIATATGVFMNAATPL